ncbi:MAG: chemotaxis response regulator protein-glutamate methylesterase [Candidatus Margulisiibacteriota bacterium]|nr:MAG: hypothetical protein A2X43_12855 [Candidatus Margulisbacteria bacterium GWD2_39_127]OGI02117.1 MAG: hypothetical protein A2X42_01470 [Candidatus Margulisbacteria bacterium GWF2_38_17]OGI10494.1 MAG: hypothetical protein A2X41_06970 [Candidatus Margulisbacteria bacterium GWE2_39_32]PZM79960.1 MAG: chemotaxis response regulator protein-glutamate methylesterase [Candidatus Margulisiibacteriota bacterium]HAR62423.1 chemotaxis response regulator protein-glutamate methylesterase [Candidatus M
MAERIKVMIVDDAAYIRFILTKYLSQEPDIEVIATATNGIDALKKLEEIRPDVMTVDIEMPGMNGIELLKKVMSTNPVPIIMLSSLSPEISDITIKALQYGAIDFINKDSIKLSVDVTKVHRKLIDIIKTAKMAKLKKLEPDDQITAAPIVRQTSFKITKAQIIAIGCSTGGPKALYHLVPLLPPNLPAGIVIVQHMPAKFTTSLANRLNEISKISVKEAEDGDLVLPGRVLIAPGDYHMEIKANFTVKLNQSPHVNHVRPAVDVLFNSLPAVYGKNITGIILTGMGQDGANGAETIKKSGGYIIAEAESTCTIYGMPKVIAERNLADKVLPLTAINEQIISFFKNKGEL